MVEKVELICKNCKDKYVKDAKEHKRTILRGYNTFCSKKCLSEFQRQNQNQYTEHLQAWYTSERNKEHLVKLQKQSKEKYDETERGIRELLKRARNSAKKKSLDNTLTLDQIKQIWDNQRGVCQYTGWQLQFPICKLNKTPYTASLDRIDSDKGYVAENIQIISVMANYAKNDFNEEIMKEFCMAIKNKP